MLGGAVNGFETDEKGNISFSPENFIKGFIYGSAGAFAISRAYKSDKLKKTLYNLNEKAYLKAQDLDRIRLHKTLEKYNVSNLKTATQEQYEDFIDKILSKDYKAAPNILKIANLDKNLAEKLQLINSDVFLTKNNFSHFRIDRKEKFLFDTRDKRR